jgi:hypothetical protein
MLALIQTPPFKILLLFWFILGIVSTSFAEVLAGSMPFPLFNPTGWLITIPLYTLHILVLGTIAIKHKPSFYRLYLFGILFGLYEAYITKVLWDPPWDPIVILNGVAIIETAVLILFWHPIISFIIPLVLADQTMSKNPTIISTFPIWLSNFITNNYFKLTLFYAVLFGITHSLGLNNLWSLLASISLLASTICLILLWTKTTKNKYTFSELLPNKTQTFVLMCVLIVFYIISGITLRHESIPGLPAQAIIWVIYILVAALIFFESRRYPIITSPVTLTLSRQQKLIATTLFLAVSASAPLIGSNLVTIISTVVNWTISILIGSAIITLTVKRATNL